MSSAPVPALAPSPVPATVTTTGGRSNGRNNRRRNGNQDNSSGNSNKFVPKLTTIKSLVSSSENKWQDFTKFQKSIHHHALTTFKNSKDVSKAILEFVDPFVELHQIRPSLITIRTKHDLYPEPPVPEEGETAKFLREEENNDKKEMAKLLYSRQIKLSAERERRA